jgi:hypothetical protein
VVRAVVGLLAHVSAIEKNSEVNGFRIGLLVILWRVSVALHLLWRVDPVYDAYTPKKQRGDAYDPVFPSFGPDLSFPKPCNWSTTCRLR